MTERLEEVERGKHFITLVTYKDGKNGFVKGIDLIEARPYRDIEKFVHEKYGKEYKFKTV